MLEEIILHLGSPKTGSTSIQKSLADFDDGETFYAQFQSSNHSLSISSIFMKDREHYLWEKRGHSLEEVAREKIVTRELLSKYLKRSDRKRMILSGEGIGHQLTNTEKQVLIDTLQSNGARLSIFYYARDPLNFAKSIFQQRVKRGGLSYVDSKIGKSKHKKRLDKFLTELPSGSVAVHEFNRSKLYNGCVVEDFCSKIGITPKQIILDNESMSLEPLKLIFQFNQQDLKIFGNSPGVTARTKMTDLLIEIFKESDSIQSSLFHFMADFSEAKYLQDNFDIKFISSKKDDIEIDEDKLKSFLLDISDIDKEFYCDSLNSHGVEVSKHDSPLEMTTKTYDFFLNN